MNLKQVGFQATSLKPVFYKSFAEVNSQNSRTYDFVHSGESEPSITDLIPQLISKYPRNKLPAWQTPPQSLIYVTLLTASSPAIVRVFIPL